MVGYFAAVAKVTSTAVLVCSFYFINRLRTKRRRMDFSGRSHESDHESPLDGSYIADSFTYPSGDNLNAGSLLSHGHSYLRHGWRFVSGLFQSNVSTFEQRDSQVADAVQRILSSFSMEDLATYHSMAAELAKEANVNPAIRGLLSTGRRKRFRRSNNSLETMLSSLLTALSSFTKDDLFVSLLVSNEDFCQVLERIAKALVAALPTEAMPPRQPLSSPQRSECHSTDLDRSNVSDPTGSVDWPGLPSASQRLTDHPEYPYHLRLVQILANISRNPQSQLLLRGAAIQRLLSVWTVSPSLHLTLFSQKVCENLHTHLTQLTEPASSIVVYYPDVFRLDRPDFSSNESDHLFDVIFIHGMRGSVFHTWRQKDHVVDGQEIETPSTTKCWPRDWLSREFPNARILAIDASLNPFVWDPICPVDKIERTIDTRAKKILPQLRAAGIGERPIIWITHSAGGILVKELLRMSALPETKRAHHSCDVKRDPVDLRSAVFSIPNVDRFVNPSGESSQVSWFCDSDDEHAKPNVAATTSPIAEPQSPSTSRVSAPTNEACSIEDSDLTRHTAGVVFMSAPHRGNQSLFGLYRRPLRWTLTPEAIQLEQNSSFLLDLHDWFNTWASRKQVPVLSMVETRETPVNRFWSVLLVPEDEKDREMGHIVHIDSDHTYISKPRDPNDPAYTHIIQFIRQTTRTS